MNELGDMVTVTSAQATILTGIFNLFTDNDGIKSYTFDLSGVAARDPAV